VGWISRDPGGFAMGDANLYRFVGNGPTNWNDPTGLRKPPWWMSVVAGPPVALAYWAFVPTPPAPGTYPSEPFGFDQIPLAPKTEVEMQQMQNDPRFVVSKDPSWVVMVFHTGASASYRIRFVGATSGNQCTYNSSGQLITGGAAAGTPDLVQTAVAGHFVADVIPFLGLNWAVPANGWLAYHMAGWAPVNPPDAPVNNAGVPIAAPLLLSNPITGPAYAPWFYAGRVANSVYTNLFGP
jgi:hypothetical protein